MARIRSSFSISGHSIDPDAITAAMGVRPTRTSKSHPDRSGLPYWEYSPAKLEILSIESHIEHIMTALEEPLRGVIASSILEVAEGEVNLFISLSDLADGSLPHMILSPDLSQRLAETKVTLVIDMN